MKKIKNIIKIIALTGLTAVLAGCSVENKNNNPLLFRPYKSAIAEYEEARLKELKNPRKTELAYTVEMPNYIANVTNASQYFPQPITGYRLQKIHSDIEIKYKEGTNFVGKAHYLGTYNPRNHSMWSLAEDWKLVSSNGIQKKIDNKTLDYLAEEANHLTGPM
jgi:hypothetical protein